jgi:hypothetical protein
MRKLALLALCFFTLAVLAEAPASRQPVTRYHYGDGSSWADPVFDDSAWPVAANGFVPSVAAHAESFIWVRMRVPVPCKLQAPLALHLTGLDLQPTAWQAFVNGALEQL